MFVSLYNWYAVINDQYELFYNLQKKITEYFLLFAVFTVLDPEAFVSCILHIETVFFGNVFSIFYLKSMIPMLNLGQKVFIKNTANCRCQT